MPVRLRSRSALRGLRLTALAAARDCLGGHEHHRLAQKMTRVIGTNNVDNAARVCHAPSTTALKEAIGVAATTCSYRDVIESDLIVLFGADVANGQPVFMKYLYLAKKRGAKIAVVGPTGAGTGSTRATKYPKSGWPGADEGEGAAGAAPFTPLMKSVQAL